MKVTNIFKGLSDEEKVAIYTTILQRVQEDEQVENEEMEQYLCKAE